ncbi:unnamed protein product [Microthlaspi erraticum]|uniref:Pectinesterase inhibitor domain-containing protein n=1 Tax=Microthlaspi erraticum TaxID=1685480 RepID=A0A6D2HRC9_9BRAS|nr:unnamed protein product [Microthlaspi erraticum]
MESNKTFSIIVIVTLITILTPTPVNSKCTFVARSLLQAYPPSESDSPSPASASAPACPPKDIDYHTASPASPANSPPPTDTSIDSPVASPSEVPAGSLSPADASTEDSPAASPSDVPADSISDSPAASPDAPTGAVSSDAPSGKTLFNAPKNLLKPLMLSPEIKTICGKTDFPLLCESSISPLLTAQLIPDTTSVLVLAIQASMNATKAAIATVQKLDAADCQELYDDAVANLEDAVNALKARDIATVNTNLSAAMTDFGTCNDGFEESGEPNPLADVADNLTKMVSNCLAISTLIK